MTDRDHHRPEDDIHIPGMSQDSHDLLNRARRGYRAGKVSPQLLREIETALDGCGWFNDAIARDLDEVGA